ncbi:universal stress protein, partial [Dehalococcoidia bacterium]|nr:universal stress protein [Dehalococcoidia bacterium]
EKVLVATDGSRPSIMGIEHAVQIAKEKKADLIALYVDTSFSDVDVRGYDAFVWSVLKKEKNMEDEDIKEMAIGHIDAASMVEKYYKDIGKPAALLKGESSLKVAESLAEEQGVKVKTMVERGSAVKTIIKIADEENVDMIVIGSRGMTGFDRIMLGSVAEKVSALAPCPVLIVR